MLTTLGDLELCTANSKAAVQAVEEADRLRDMVGVPSWNDVCVERTSGEIALRVDDLARAIEIAESALERDLSPRGRARMCNLLALALASAGDLEAAQDVFQEELEVLVGAGQEAEISIAHGNIAEAAMRLGQPARAAMHQRASLELALALGQRVSVAYSLMVAARLAGIHGDWREAVELNAHAAATLEESDHRLYESDQIISDELLAEARSHLGQAAFEGVLAEGPRLTTVEAVAMAERVFAALPERAASSPKPVV
jgi:tetratricopeptide (TPR) repeat protein